MDNCLTLAVASMKRTSSFSFKSKFDNELCDCLQRNVTIVCECLHKDLGFYLFMVSQHESVFEELYRVMYRAELLVMKLCCREKDSWLEIALAQACMSHREDILDIRDDLDRCWDEIVKVPLTSGHPELVGGRFLSRDRSIRHLVWPTSHDELQSLKQLEEKLECLLRDDVPREKLQVAKYLSERVKVVIHSNENGGLCPLLPNFPIKFRSDCPISEANGMTVTLLANGSGGTRVWKTKLLSIDCAVKVVPCNDPKVPLRQVQKLALLSHPHVMKLLCFYWDDIEIQSWMEQMDKDLGAFIEEKTGRLSPAFSMKAAVNVITQIAKGMKYLHDSGVAHRDLKSLNILVKWADNPKELCEPYLHAMVADFDQVKLFSPTSAGAMVQSIPNVGTTQWRAPEAQTLRKDGSVQMTDPKAADVYSFAMVCSEVLSGKTPFDAMGAESSCEGIKKISDGKRPPLPPDSPKLLKKLIRDCWDHKPTKRPHFEEILKRLLNVQSLFLSGTLSGSKQDYDHGTSYIVPSFIKRMWPISLLKKLFGPRSSTRKNRKRGSDIPSEVQDVSLYPHELVRSFQALYVERPTHGAEKKNVKVVVGLDLGTTHTGVAYARVSQPNEIFVIREWPMGGEASPKTLTAIYYNSGASSSEQYLDGILWGFSAHCSYNSALQVLEKNGSGNNSTLGFYSADLKQLFAADHASEMVSPQLGSQTGCRALSDYFKELSKFVFHHLEETYGGEIKLEMEMLEWCITMPINWSPETKEKMRDCLVTAGLLQVTHEAMDANPLPPQLLPELEAAACYCHNNINSSTRLEPGDRFVVVDIGSGIVKSIVQHWSGDDHSGYGVETEHCDFLSGLYPQNLLENKFFHFLSTEIKCFEACMAKYPSIRASLLQELEALKMSSFDPNYPNYALEISLPFKLANFWRENDKPIHGMKRRRNYNKLVLPNVEEFFDPLVVPILEFVERHVHRPTNIKIIFLVGGYANLPILAEKITENFRSKVDHIITPKDPGNAVSQGAVQLGLNLQDLLERDMEVAGSSSTPEGDGSVPKDDGHHRPESKDDDFHPGPHEGKGKSPIQYNPSSSSADAKGGRSTMGEGSSTSPQSEKVVVAIDFGTSCVRSANSLHTPGDYRRTTEMYYRKHEDKWKVQGWGLDSRSIYLSEDAHQLDEIEKEAHVSPSGAFVTKCKLLLADIDIGRAISPMTPSSLNVTDIISDYLREYGKHILVDLQRGAGYDIPLEAIQWCITVPSIWDENAKQQMKDCMVRAGLVRGPTNKITGSLHPVILLLESEAASVEIASTLNLEKGDKFLVADIGAGTTVVVVQEWLGDSSKGYKMKEVCKSVGGLCGSSLVDNNFLAFLSLKVGPWLTGYLERFPSFRLEVLQAWKPIKCNYEVNSVIPKLQFPRRLVAAVRGEGHKLSGELALLQADMEMIFNPVVGMIKDLIATQLSQVGDIKTIVLVGGFSRSFYLTTKLREEFWNMARDFLFPCLENFVVNGALNMALKLGGLVSRISRTTYGLGLSLESEGVSPLEDHVNLAKETECGSQIFRIDVLEGECVQEDSCAYSVHTPLLLGQKTMKFTLYSSSDVYPRYTDEESVTKQWDFVIDISEFAEASTKPEVGVSIFYGRSCVEVEAVALFGAHKQLPVNIIVGARISNTTRKPSNLSTRTYGLGTSKFLEVYDPLEYRINTMDLCRNRFEIFIPRGMQLDACVARTFSPVGRYAETLEFTMYSTHEVSPRYITDKAMEREWGFEFDISKGLHLDGDREVSVRLYATRTWIEVSAVALNFNHPNRDLKVRVRSDRAWMSSLIFSAVDRPFLRACVGATTSRMNVQPGFYIHEFHQQQKFGKLSGRQKVVDFHFEELEECRLLDMEGVKSLDFVKLPTPPDFTSARIPESWEE